MDDLHFMERLERLGWRETELALRLYREPDMVKLLLDDAKAPEAHRVAIALSPGPSPPHVLVARDGAFVTALAAGMSTGDHPIVPHARIALAADRHEALKGQLAYIDWAAENPGSIRRLLRAVTRAGHRLPREVIIALAPIFPVFAVAAEALTYELHPRVDALVRDGSNRYVRERPRLGARDLEALESLWRSHWAIAHLVGLMGYADRTHLDPIIADTRKTGLPFLYGLPAMTFGDLPAMLRVGWMAARAGAPVLRLAQGYLQAPNHRADLHALAASLQIAFVGAAHARLRAEAQKALRGPLRVDGHEGSVLGFRAIFAELLEPDPLADPTHARAYLVEHLAEVAARVAGSVPGGFVLPTGDEPLALAMLSLLPTNMFSSLRVTAALLPALAWFARCDLADLYVPEHRLDALAPWKPEDSLQLLRASLSWGTYIKAPPEPQPARPGRNDACPCGSGKKYKRCCGA